MPDNNAKLIPAKTLAMLKDKYKIVYDANKQAIYVMIANTNRKTEHELNQPFHINSKVNPKRKVCFNVDTINIWLEINQMPKETKWTLFDVQNAKIALKLMYHKQDTKSVLEYMKANFVGVKRI